MYIERKYLLICLNLFEGEGQACFIFGFTSVRGTYRRLWDTISERRNLDAAVLISFSLG